MRLALAVFAVAALAGCASLPEEQLTAADMGRACAQLAQESDVLAKGSLGSRIVASGGAPSGCAEAAYDAAARSDGLRLVSAYENGVRPNQ